jgi:hypothetical protein
MKDDAMIQVQSQSDAFHGLNRSSGREILGASCLHIQKACPRKHATIQEPHGLSILARVGH